MICTGSLTAAVSIRKGKERYNMAQLWGGRFTKETDALVYASNASIAYDKRLLPQDICGSRVHARMLTRQGILTQE